MEALKSHFLCSMGSPKEAVVPPGHLLMVASLSLVHRVSFLHACLKSLIRSLHSCGHFRLAFIDQSSSLLNPSLLFSY